MINVLENEQTIIIILTNLSVTWPLLYVPAQLLNHDTSCGERGREREKEGRGGRQRKRERNRETLDNQESGQVLDDNLSYTN